MEVFKDLQFKIEKYIKKFYLGLLIKGVILFLCIGVFYALFWGFIEYLFWLPKYARFLVFSSILFVEGYLFLQFVISPILKYTRIKKGMGYEQAAELIGAYFPEVEDKLLNAVQLQRQGDAELILENIKQKTAEFNSISFERAIKIRNSFKYLTYVLAPLLILVPFYLFGEQKPLKASFSRVINFQGNYTPPPPFVINIENDSLTAVQGENFALKVKATGRTIPDDLYIKYDNKQHRFKNIENSVFEYVFTDVAQDISFQIFSDRTSIKQNLLKALPAPKVKDATIVLDYPKYTNLESNTITSLSNVSVPEGTKIIWNILANNTDSVAISFGIKKDYFVNRSNKFYYSKQFFNNAKYEVSTTNQYLKEYETVNLSVKVLKDGPPGIDVESERANELDQELFFFGYLDDDYGVSELQVVYYPIGLQKQTKTVSAIPFDPKSLTFSYRFPGNTALVEDTTYEIYFEVFDGYPFSEPNSSRSQVFTYRSKTKSEIESQQVKEQYESLLNIEQSQSNSKDIEKELEHILKKQRQQNTLEFNDRRMLKEIIEKQAEQDQLIREFNQRTAQLLKKTDIRPIPPAQKELFERVRELNKKIDDDQKALDELKSLADKINKEDFVKKLNSIVNQRRLKQRSVQQMLELTKRYYIKQKIQQIKNRLQGLSSEQQEAHDTSELHEAREKQNEINRKFNDLSNEMESMLETNSSLSKPMELPDFSDKSESIKKDLEQAIKALSKTNNNNENSSSEAKVPQRKAYQKMQNMADQISQGLSIGSGKFIQEDIEMLRQILDNLILFSFEQESLIKSFSTNQHTSIKRSTNLVKQKTLRTHFEHIDDSLFVISLRQPSISQDINTDIQDVFINIDRTLDLYSDSNFSQAISAQRYALTASNNLADLLSDILGSMEMQLSQGQGEGDMQLPDIIISQQELQQKAEGMSSGNNDNLKGKEEEGSEGGRGNESKARNKGEDGLYDSEEHSEAIMQLYKQQQKLRMALESLLKAKGIKTKGNNVLRAIADIERHLINEGASARVISQMRALKYKLLKFEKALNNQGQAERRQSSPNVDLYESNYKKSKRKEIENRLQMKEHLRRENLPLTPEYKKRVFDYFKKNYDKSN